ncbi:MAG: NTP transferase domain-containing protein [Clostridia bacterium]|nr:NTP transferase domain-containing protein [Clostridia bacterium]
MTIGFLLMSGGLSSRMGQPKALLEAGGETLLARITRTGAGFDERILSVNDPSIPTPEGYARIGDRYEGCGPMGGLHACLSACASDALLAVPCDAPHYTAAAAAFLAAQMEDGIDAVLPEDDEGRVHPMMGVYAKSCLPALTAHLDEGKYKLMRMLDTLRVKRVRLPEEIPQAVFANLNTPEDYAALRRSLLGGDVQRIAREAGRIILSFGAYDVEQKEGHANFVTSVDKAVQDYLSAALPQALPGSRFIGEEQENETLTAAPTWIIDPVDGTTNLIHDYRQSAVSIALCENGAPVIAAVYQPYTDEMFFAEKGCGAALNGRPIRAAQTPFYRALACFGTSPYNAALAERSMALALAFLRSCADIRRSGSAALDLCHVACGRIDVFFELVLQPWDFAAGALLVTEAGGRFMAPFNGGVVRFDRPQGVFAANAVCAEDALRLIEAGMQG